MRLIVQAEKQRDIFIEDIRQFEKAILCNPEIIPLKVSPSLHAYLNFRSYWNNKTGRKRTIVPGNMGPCELLNSPKSIFLIQLGYSRKAFDPYSYIPATGRMIYMFDAWPKNYESISRFVNQYAIDKVFVSASQSATDLNKLVGKNNFHYVPEGVDPTIYHASEYEQKDIDVLALGRKYEAHHKAIKESLEQNQRNYRYEVSNGQLIFPDRKAFIDGLSRTKISICVPSSITHPQRSGHVETMTMRYLQSMASKCLIVGHAPKEMIELFGYNPVIEIDWLDPAGQIESILQDFHLHIPLIERNYIEVSERHTWATRFNQIKRILCGNNGTNT